MQNIYKKQADSMSAKGYSDSEILENLTHIEQNQLVFEAKLAVALNEDGVVAGRKGIEKLNAYKSGLQNNLYVKSGSFWESLSDIGTGIGWDKTLASDWRLMAVYVNNDVVHQLVFRNSQAVANTPWSIYKEEDDDEFTKRTHRLRKKKYISSRDKKCIAHRNKGIYTRCKHHIKDIDNLEEQVDCELLQFLTNDIEQLSPRDMILLIAEYVQLLGKAYVQLIKASPTSFPTGLRMLKPYYIYPQRTLDGTVIGYYYVNIYGPSINSYQMPGLWDRVQLDVNDVIPFRNPAPTDPYGGGDSPVRAAYQKVAASVKFNELMSDMLNRRARIDGILSSGIEMGKAEHDKLEKDFNNKFGLSGNGGVFVPDSPNVKFTPVVYSPTDLAPLAVNDALRIALHNVLNVPIVLSDPNPNRAGIEFALEQWTTEAVAPLGGMIEAQFNKHLVPLFDETKEMFMAFDNFVKQDEAFEDQQEQTAIKKVSAMSMAVGTFDKNEIRDVFELPPIDNGDDVSNPVEPENPQVQPTSQGNGDANHDQSLNGQTGDGGVNGTLGDLSTPQPKSVDMMSVLTLNIAVKKGEISRAKAINLLVATYDIENTEARNLLDNRDEEPKEIQWQKVIKPTKKVLDEIETQVRKFAAKQHIDILHQISKAKKEFDANKVTKGDYGPTESLPSQFVEEKDWNDDLAYRIQPILEVQAKVGMDDTIDTLARAGASPDVFSVTPTNLEKAIDKRALVLAQSTNDTTLLAANDALKILKVEIGDGLFAGDPISELTKRIQTIFTNLSDYRATTIARTESSAVTHLGQAMSAKDSGIVKAIRLLVSSDACDICQDAQAETAMEDVDLSGALDNDTLPPLHPNCMCSFTQVIDTDKLKE